MVETRQKTDDELRQRSAESYNGETNDQLWDLETTGKAYGSVRQFVCSDEDKCRAKDGNEDIYEHIMSEEKDFLCI